MKSMMITISAAIGLLLAACNHGNATAYRQPLMMDCDKDGKRIIEFLEGEKYKEEPIAVGEFSGSAFLLYHNKETKTFTLLGLIPDGTVCMITSGKNLEFDDSLTLDDDL